MFIMLFGRYFLLCIFMKTEHRTQHARKVRSSILHLGLAFGVLWYAAVNPDSRGMVNMGWFYFTC